MLTRAHDYRVIERESGTGTWDFRVTCACGFRSHWHASKMDAFRAADRHADTVAAQ